MRSPIKTVDDVVKLLPTSEQEIRSRAAALMERTTKGLDIMLAIPDSQRTFANTPRELDRLVGELGQEAAIFQAASMVSPHEIIRNVTQEIVIALHDYSVEKLSQNKKVYLAVKAYAEGAGKTDKLNDEERYVLDEALKSFKREGLDLHDEQSLEVKRIQKELAKLGLQFEKNINDDVQTLEVTEAELKGLSPEFIGSLPHEDKNGIALYALNTSYPVLQEVLANCTVENTRKNVWKQFVNRAYPANDQLLKQIIALRDELAHRLGFKSYAHYELDDSMAETPEVVEKFLDDLAKRSLEKAEQEVQRYKAQLPDGVTLTPEGKLKNWDWGMRDGSFIKTDYRKKKFNLDPRIIAEYFPVDETLNALLKVYEDFLGIQFRSIPVHNAWHEDVRAIEVLTRDGKILGYFLLDLYPRPHKYTHACHATLLLSRTIDGVRAPGAALIIANFPKAMAGRPALLSHNDVETFFHEFGHALHGLFGATELYSCSGTSVKHDFVEVPSQMLEEWMWSPEIIKRVSHHYKTGKPLPDDIIAKMVELKNFDMGDFVRRQLTFAHLSLDYFKPGASKDTIAIMHNLQDAMRPYVAVDLADHFQASFGHLIGYGARYYSYLWSKVYALDLFDYIKHHGGLLNPEMGKRYVDLVLAPGGSRPPQELLRAFLGREPSSDAFFKDLGL